MKKGNHLNRVQATALGRSTKEKMENLNFCDPVI
jgi:hypothetical protein